MIDLNSMVVASEFRRDVLLHEARQDRIVRDASRAAQEPRPSLLGVLVAALLAIVATGAIAPR